MVTLNFPVDQVIYSTCRYHTNGINMQCMDCLVISGYLLPPLNENPYLTLLPPGIYHPIDPQLRPVSGTMIGANNMIPSHEESYMYKMRFALQEMDRQYEFVPNGYFLDLGWVIRLAHRTGLQELNNSAFSQVLSGRILHVYFKQMAIC
jgi:hypothetical protein